MSTLTFSQSHDDLDAGVTFLEDAAKLKPEWSLTRLIIEGCFSMPSEGDDSWPSLEQVAEFHEELGIVLWLTDFWVCNDSNQVEYEALTKFHEPFLNPYEKEYLLLPAVRAANDAWGKVRVFTCLEQKTLQIREAVNKQADNMIDKLQASLEAGDICEGQLHKRALATEDWRRSKSLDVQKHLLDKLSQAMAAAHRASGLILEFWFAVRGNMESEAQREKALAAVHEEEIKQLRGEMEDEIDKSMLLQELEAGMDTLSLDDSQAMYVEQTHYKPGY